MPKNDIQKLFYVYNNDHNSISSDTFNFGSALYE